MMDTLPNVGNDLVRIHKVITRALDVSLENSQDANMPEDHRPGFVSYVHSLAIVLHAHHAGEDALAFPFWKARLPSGPFAELRRQHEQMLTCLEHIDRWTAAGPEAWLAVEIAALHHALSELRALWVTHIALEEETIGPEKCRQHLSQSENEQLGKELSEHGQAHAQPGALVMPFVVYNLSAGDRSEFVKLLPPVVRDQLIPVAWKATWEPMTPFVLP